MSVGIDGASVTQGAQRHDVTRQQVCAWRHGLKRRGLWEPDNGAFFPPLDVPFASAAPAFSDPAPSISGPALIELRLQGGRCLRFDSVMDAEALTQLIRAVEAA